jgi:hypothetical protein
MGQRVQYRRLKAILNLQKFQPVTAVFYKISVLVLTDPNWFTVHEVFLEPWITPELNLEQGAYPIFRFLIIRKKRERLNSLSNLQ